MCDAAGNPEMPQDTETQGLQMDRGVRITLSNPLTQKSVDLKCGLQKNTKKHNNTEKKPPTPPTPLLKNMVSDGSESNRKGET